MKHGGAHHLCPFSKAQLNKARCTPNIGKEMYEKMRAFNQLLSSQRITIERAFGILLRRWGILWKPLEYSLHRNTRIIQVCVKLHNICIDRHVLMNTNPFQERIGCYDREWRLFVSQNKHRRRHTQQQNNDGEEATNEEIKELFENINPTTRRSMQFNKCLKREFLKEWIFSQGYTYDSNLDAAIND